MRNKLVLSTLICLHFGSIYAEECPPSDSGNCSYISDYYTGLGYSCSATLASADSNCNNIPGGGTVVSMGPCCDGSNPGGQYSLNYCCKTIPCVPTCPGCSGTSQSCTTGLTNASGTQTRSITNSGYCTSCTCASGSQTCSGTRTGCAYSSWGTCNWSSCNQGFYRPNGTGNSCTGCTIPATNVIRQTNDNALVRGTHILRSGTGTNGIGDCYLVSGTYNDDVGTFTTSGTTCKWVQ